MHRHDFNSTLGEGKTFPNWDDIKHHWDAYAQDALVGAEGDSEDDDAGPIECRKKGQRRPQAVLPAGNDGTPLIPIILDMQALECKDIMRTFVTWHYHKSCLLHQHLIHHLAQERHVESQVPVFHGLP